MSEIRRNLEQGDIYLNHFWSGLVTNRSPLFTPISSFGIQMIQRMDCLIGGLNMELSPKATLWRRYGFTQYCTAGFGTAQWPRAFYGFKNIAGALRPVVDTQTAVLSFSSSTQTQIFAKAAGAGQSSIITVGNQMYFCDGVSVPQKWDGANQWMWGIATPSITPGLSFGSGSLSPTSGYSYVYCYFNPVTGQLSSASPYSANTGPQTSKNITVGYTKSADPQVSNIWIFRTLDGGSLYYLLAQVPNLTSSYTDSTADSGLNTDLVAPVAGVNNPPPAGMAHVAFYASRPWGAVGNVLFFGAGPDATIGVGTECWPGANNFTVQGNITSLNPLSIGLAVLTEDTLYLLTGTDITSFDLNPWQKNFGVMSENAVTQDGDVLYVFTSRSLFYSIQYGVGLSEIGFNIRGNLAAINPSNVYVTLHRSGADEGIFVSDGSTNLWRYGLDFGAWSPVAQPLMGCNAIGSIETSTGTWSLLMGQAAGSGNIFFRDPTSFSDNGKTYSCFAQIGSLVIAPPGQVAVPEKILVQITSLGAGWTYPTVSVLPNNVTGTFTALPYPKGDPPHLAGTAYESTNPLSKCHYWKCAASPLPQEVQNLQIEIAFTTDSTQSEILGVGVM